MEDLDLPRDDGVMTLAVNSERIINYEANTCCFVYQCKVPS